MPGHWEGDLTLGHNCRSAIGTLVERMLRQYFPKGTDLSVHSAIDLDWVATELNDRPANT